MSIKQNKKSRFTLLIYNFHGHVPLTSSMVPGMNSLWSKPHIHSEIDYHITIRSLLHTNCLRSWYVVCSPKLGNNFSVAAYNRAYQYFSTVPIGKKHLGQFKYDFFSSTFQ